jgi:acetoin utilization deacetylase AcuC-like enzyme
MLPFKLVYHPDYDLDLGEHVFPWRKYRMVRDELIETGIADSLDFIQPGPAPDEDLLRIHTQVWVERLKHGTLGLSEIWRLEIPYTRQMARAFWLAAGGTTLAARLALRYGIGFHIGGGFHHAFPDHGEGFCALHDAAVAVRRLQHEGLIERVMVVDCDVHHGNGTAAIFADDRNVFTLSIHQSENYPSEKPPSDLDINLEDGTGDDEYLDRLHPAFTRALVEFRPQLLFYVAGADPYCQDQLGGLELSIDGLRERDQMVFTSALREEVPVAVTLAGGYAVRLEDTIAIHTNSVKAAKDALEREGWQPHITGSFCHQAG